MRRTLLFTLAFCTVQHAETVVRLVPDWQVKLNLGSGVLYAAVCPDGSVYAVSRSGEVNLVSRQGEAGGSWGRGIFRIVDAVACASDGKLYVTGRNSSGAMDSLAIVSNTGRFYRSPRVTDLGVRITSIAVLDRDNIAVAGDRTGSSFPLHLMSRTGRLIRSFGEGDGAGTVDPELTNGFLLWSEHRRQLFFVPRHLPEVQIYASDGTPVAVRGFGTNRPAAAQFGQQGSLDEIRGAAILPTGHILVQASVRSLMLLSPDVSGEHFEMWTDLGLLAGSDRYGGIYFVERDRIGRAHVQSHLKPPSQHGDKPGRAVI